MPPELVAEIIASPGVRVHGPPVAVTSDAAALVPPDTVPGKWAAGFVSGQETVAEKQRAVLVAVADKLAARFAPRLVGLAGVALAGLEVFEALQAPPARRRRRKKR